MQYLPAEFAAEFRVRPERNAGMVATVRLWMEDGIAAGYCYPAGKPDERRPYRGLDGLLLRLEELMDRNGFPHRPEKLHSIPGAHKKRYRPADCPMLRIGRTVSIHIYYRQYCSMQGELCLQDGQKVWFRSALELLVLLQQVVSDRL